MRMLFECNFLSQLQNYDYFEKNLNKLSGKKAEKLMYFLFFQKEFKLFIFYREILAIYLFNYVIIKT